MNLVIDIGNTRSKLAVFEDNRMLDKRELQTLTKNDLNDIIDNKLIIRCIVSSVQKINPELIDFLKEKKIGTEILDHNTNLPFKNAYITPETLGKDRIAAVAGACFLYPGKNVLIIDAGTAITFDFIDDTGRYQGGTISPGLEMRFKALNKFTDALPLIDKTENSKLIGKNTREAIENGVQNGMIFEIEGYLTKFGKKYSQLIVLLTGGDGPFFDNKLKKPIFAVSNLTLVGLNFILDYNAQTY